MQRTACSKNMASKSDFGLLFYMGSRTSRRRQYMTLLASGPPRSTPRGTSWSGRVIWAE